MRRARSVGRRSTASALDVASVVYTRAAGLSQDFTTDHDKLLQAIEAFSRGPLRTMANSRHRRASREGDMQRHDQAQSVVAVRAAAAVGSDAPGRHAELAGITQRRKTIIYISPGAAGQAETPAIASRSTRAICSPLPSGRTSTSMRLIPTGVTR